MTDLDRRLQSLAQVALATPEPVDALRARNRRRILRRRLIAGGAVAAALALVWIGLGGGSNRPTTVRVVPPLHPTVPTPSPVATTPVPPTTPADPSGHFQAGWLPPGLEFVSDTSPTHRSGQPITVISTTYYAQAAPFEDATTFAPNYAESDESVAINAVTGGAMAAIGTPAGTVEGHGAIVVSLSAAPGPDIDLFWKVRPGLGIQLVGQGVSLAVLERVADSIYELSVPAYNAQAEVSETVAVPIGTGPPARVAVTTTGSEICATLSGDSGGGICGDDPAVHPIAIGVTNLAPYTVFGVVGPWGVTVEVHLSDGQTLSSATVAAPGSEARIWAVALPGADPVASVSALGAHGDVIAVRDILVGSPGSPPAPWTAAPVAQSTVPAALVQAWQADSTRSFCPALAFTSTGVEGGVARVADFGSNAWATAYDKPGLPGTLADGEFSPTAGRSVFGVACVGLPDIVHTFDGMPDHLIFADGSRVDFGPSGSGGSVWIADIHIQGATDGYEVWSALGEGQLRLLISGLRFVSGLGTST